jgi:hypothetical protein
MRGAEFPRRRTVSGFAVKFLRRAGGPIYAVEPAPAL